MSFTSALTDLRPLRSSLDFRRVWAASLLTGVTGQSVTVAALAQVWTMTQSPVWTGAIGLARGIPLLLLGPLGGSLADRYDRRRVLLVTTALQLLVVAGLVAQAALSLASPLLVLGLLAAQSGVGALSSPSNATLPVRLLPANEVPAGLALRALGFQVSLLLGPALGGLLTGVSVPLAYGVALASTPAALIAYALLPVLPPRASNNIEIDDDEERATPPRKPTSEPGGWLFAWRNGAVRGALLTDLAMTSLSMPIAIFPMINDLRFAGDPRTLGLFLSSIAVGGLVASVFSGRYTRIRRAGLAQTVCALVWGATMIGFGLVGAEWVAFLCLAVAGAVDTIGVVARGALVQLVTPDSFRGRVSAIDHVVGAAGPEIGSARGGVLAAIAGAPAALVIGGASAMLAVLGIWSTSPGLRSYRAVKEKATAA